MPALHSLEISSSRRCEIVDLTSQLQSFVRASGVKEGLCTVFCPHTTAAVVQ